MPIRKSLHLDSEYRRRWEEFHLDDGTVEDSREKNWREVEWERVEKIVVHMTGKVYEVDNLHPNFWGFMNFRCGGVEPQYDSEGRFINHRPIHTWVVGWTDGKLCYLKEIDFYRGDLLSEYTSPLKELKNHIHPRLNINVNDL